MSRPRYEGLDQPVNPTATPRRRLCRWSRARRESETGGSQLARSVLLVETFVIRMWLPDRPGALGQIASRIGAVGGDVVGIDILERENGQAVDELVVELPDPALVELLVGAGWVAIADIEGRGDGVAAASDGAPDARWLEAFLAGSRAAGADRGCDSGPGDIVWAPLPCSGLAVVLGREGMPYRARERRQVAALARVVDTRLRELHRARSRARHPSR